MRAVKKFIFLESNFTISENLVFPQGYTIFGQPGLQITFANNAKLVSYSPLNFIGEEHSPIIVKMKGQSKSSISLINTTENQLFQMSISLAHLNLTIHLRVFQVF